MGEVGPTSGSALPTGAALMVGDRAAMLVGRPTRRSLGPALLWATMNVGHHGARPGGLARLDVVLDPSAALEPADAEPGDAEAARLAGADVDDPLATAGQLARLGGLFTPDIRVWVVDGSNAAQVHAAAPPPVVAPPTDEAADLIELLRDVGLDVVAEPGMILGEVAGLEVARVTVERGEAHLAIGVGRFDQELSAVAQAELPRRDALIRAADLVRLARTMGNASHPMTRLARERWLRAELLRNPAKVGARRLEALPGLWLRQGLREPAPAAALGEDDAGEPLVVVASSGVDPDLVPTALDQARAADPAARVVLALPPADRLPATERVAALAHTPVDLVSVTPPWEPLRPGR